MSRSTAFYGLLITTAAAFVIGVAALILSSINASNGGSSTTLFLLTPSVLLSLYSSESQRFSSAGGVWNAVTFDQQIPVNAGAGMWTHVAGSGIIECNRAGSYTVYFSVHAQLNESVITAIPLECKAQYLRYAIRGVQLADGIMREIQGSFTYSNGMNLFLAKQFFIEATVGDRFQFEVVSPCATMTLYPDAHIGIPVTSAIRGTYPSSTTLMIST